MSNDILVEIGKYFDFYDVAMCYLLSCKRIYNSLFINNHNRQYKTIQHQIDNIVSFLYKWVPTIDDKAKKCLENEAGIYPTLYANCDPERIKFARSSHECMIHAQNVLLRDGFF